MSSTTAETYNGWKNYPTWNVNLWLSSDEGLYNRTLETIESAREAYDDEEQETPWRVFVADWMKDFVNEDVFEDAFSPELKAQSSLADDLAGWALGQVDWFEIADAWLETAGEQS